MTAPNPTPLVIVNPKAGSSSRQRHDLDALRKVIEGALGKVDFALTNHPGHAIELAEASAREHRATVVATGGDGSIHEVVNGLMRARDAGFASTRLGIIGRGTGSDLCRTLGLGVAEGKGAHAETNRLDRFLAAIAGGRTDRIDVGRLRYTDHGGARREAFFVNILSAGMGGLVDQYVRSTTQWLGGQAAYFVASTRALLDSQVGVLAATIEMNGETREEELSTRQIAICNGRYFGSGMHVAPMAKVDDGVFEVIDLGSAGRLKFAIDSSAIYKGEHLRNPDVRHFRCQKITLDIRNERARSRFLLDVDGEPLGVLPIEVELVPSAIEVLIPA
ncbi:MAG: diacylglycerol kinase family protein [Polyangiaceae bacterium]